MHQPGMITAASEGVDVSTLVQLLSEARSAIAENPVVAERMIERATDLLRPRSVDKGSPAELIVGGLAPWQIRKVRTTVAEGLEGRLSTSALAKRVGLSASHFARAFKASTGHSPRAFVMRQRIDRARALMIGTDMPLCEVALECGFADQAHLSRLFRQLVGFSPSTWRRMNTAREARHAAGRLPPGGS